MWLVPYKFVQRVTGDVDFRIMGTFVEFYTTLLGFVNFRLYTTIGLIYPPRFNAKSDEQGGELDAIVLEGRAIEAPEVTESGKEHVSGGTNGELEPRKSIEEIQKQIAAIKEGSNAEQDVSQTKEQKQASDQENNDDIDTFEPVGEDADVLAQPQASGDEVDTLFAPFTFFLSRETPRQPLEFILRAFGCKRIGWDLVLGDGAFTNNEADPTITHQVVDRPPLASHPQKTHVSKDPLDPASKKVVKPGHRVPGRTYIQPQWVWDCINQAKLLRPDLYAPGATLPPHLSPWVKPTKGAYDPSAPLAEQEREGEAEEAERALEEEDRALETAEKGVASPPATSKARSADPQDDHGMTIAVDDSDSELASDEASSFAGFSSAPESSPEPTTQTQHQLELEAEASGLNFSSEPPRKANGQPVKGILKSSSSGGGGNKGDVKARRKRREEEEELERRKMMMGRKKRKMLDKMLYSNRQKEGEAEALRAKRRKIEAGKK